MTIKPNHDFAQFSHHAPVLFHIENEGIVRQQIIDQQQNQQHWK
jgi:hypothetical protein